jgi:hypothetical protein
MPFEMFAVQNMDNFLKLKLEVTYRDMPIDQARTRFEELKQQTSVAVVEAAKKPRKLKK